MKDQSLAVPHNALVLVGDGRKAVLLRNAGTPLHPKLTLEQLLEHPSEPTRNLGTDRPGRAVSGPGRAKSAIAETDWHQLEETRFVAGVVEALSRAERQEEATPIVVVMPPKALGELRARMDETLRKHIIAEIPKDLTSHPIDDIERHLAMRE